MREEANKKLSVLGLYTSNQILVPLDTKEVVLPALCFLIIFRDGEGSFSASVELAAPSGKKIGGGILPAKVVVGEAGYNMILNFIPFRTDEFGDFHISINLNGHQYRRSLSISKSDRISV